MTQARTREETIKKDVPDLHKLGYAQELFRSMGGFSNFAISFSIISILTGAVILYDYGLAWAGTAAVLIGWPLVTVFVLLIAAPVAETPPAHPPAGGLNAAIIERCTAPGFGNTTEFIPGVLNGQLVTMGVLMLIQLLMNIAGINLVALLNQVSVWWHVAIVAAVVVFIFLPGKPDQSGLTLFALQPQDVGGTWDNTFPPAGRPGAENPIFSFKYGAAAT